MSSDRPRTFEEVVAATDPEELARLNRGGKYDAGDCGPVPARSACMKIATALANGMSHFDDDGGCYVTVFAGPEAERRAREYFAALKSGQLRTIRASTVSP